MLILKSRKSKQYFCGGNLHFALLFDLTKFEETQIMCNRKILKSPPPFVAERLGAELDDLFFPISDDVQYAFDHPYCPIVKADNPNVLCTNYRWGLIPANWQKTPKEIWDSTYNAKIEYLFKRYAYKNITHQRCLVPSTSYFEYHWNDAKGKTKTLYEVIHHDIEIFTLAGLYSTYVSTDGEIYNTYTVITTEANDRMRFVHNKDAQKDYHRMPLMLNPEDERSWLDTKIPYMDFAYPNYQPRLIAEPAEGERLPPPQLSLF